MKTGEQLSGDELAAARLTADARALLLEAALPDAGPGRVKVQGQRQAQFRSGVERLRRDRLAAEAEAGGLGALRAELTPEGRRVALLLKEAEAGLVAGVPFAEREMARRLLGYRDYGAVTDAWAEVVIEGEAAYTNGELIAFGQAPSEKRLDPGVTSDQAQRVWRMMTEGEAPEVEPFAYSECPTYKERHRLVWFPDGAGLKAANYLFLMSLVSGRATWRHDPARDERDRPSKAFRLYDDDRLIAVAAPLNWQPPKGVVEMQARLAPPAPPPAPTAVAQSGRTRRPPCAAVQLALLTEQAA